MGEYLDSSGVQQLWSAAKNTLVNDIGVVSSTSGRTTVSGTTGSMADDQTQGGIGATYYATGTTNIGAGCNNVAISSGSCTYNTSTGIVSWKIPGLRANQSVSATLTWEGGTALTTVKDGVVEKVAHFNTINGQSIVNTDGTVNIEVGGDIDLSNYSTKNETVSDVWINEEEPDMLYITKGGSDYEYPLPSISLYRHFIMLYILSSEENWTTGQFVHFEILNRRSTPYTTEAQVASALNDYGTVPCSATNTRNDYTDARLVRSDGYDIIIEIASSDAECVTAEVHDDVKPI